MRSDYPLLSQELNDRLLMTYDYMVDLLGYEEANVHYSGILERLEASGQAFVVSSSGLPTALMDRMVDMIKFDYIYRTHYNQIRYLETTNGK